MPRLDFARTLVVVDTHHDDIPGFVEALFDAGADIIQLRDPAAPLAVVGTAAVTAQQIALPRNRPLVAVTSDLVLARAVMADVLVGSPGLDPELAHARMHEYALVGAPMRPASCYSVSSNHFINFALVGPVHLAEGSPWQRRVWTSSASPLVRCRPATRQAPRRSRSVG